MQECRFCQGTINDEDIFCKSCGYDPKTDKISPDFVSSSEQSLKPAGKKSVVVSGGGGVSPGIKKFALIGVIVIVFSIFYRNHFSLSNVVAETKHFFTMLAKGKISIGQSKNSNKEIEYIDVRTFQDKY